MSNNNNDNDSSKPTKVNLSAVARAAAATTNLDPIVRLKRDLVDASATLSHREARYLVDSYYQIQEARKAAGNQLLSLYKNNEPHATVGWLFSQNEAIEGQIKRALDRWTDSQPVGVWAKSITGIGPVISAGLLAHINIAQAPTVSHIWRFAGLDDTSQWLGADRAKTVLNDLLVVAAANAAEGEDLLQLVLPMAAKYIGTRVETLRRHATTDAAGNPRQLTKATLTAAMARRPWSAALKGLCWKIGESFVKTSGLESDVYGKVYLLRKAQEIANNEAGKYSERAAKALASANYGKDTAAYQCYAAGKLPPAHIHARAKRYAVKLFLSHLHHVMYVERYGKQPPAPYPIVHMGHNDYFPPPNYTQQGQGQGQQQQQQ